VNGAVVRRRCRSCLRIRTDGCRSEICSRPRVKSSLGVTPLIERVQAKVAERKDSHDDKGGLSEPATVPDPVD